MDYRDRISRWVLAVGLWGCALWMAVHGFNELEFIWFVPALIAGSIGVAAVFNDILTVAAMPFTSMIDAIIFPKIRGGKPPPNYKLAEYYLGEDRLADAETEYRTILKHHRKETKAYLGLLRLLCEYGKIEDGRKVLKTAQHNLRNHRDDLNEIEMEWERLKAQFAH